MFFRRKDRHPWPPRARVEVVGVDMDGFTGREFHPSTSMVGWSGRVIGAHREQYEGENAEMLGTDHIWFYDIALDDERMATFHHTELKPLF